MSLEAAFMAYLHKIVSLYSAYLYLKKKSKFDFENIGLLYKCNIYLDILLEIKKITQDCLPKNSLIGCYPKII